MFVRRNILDTAFVILRLKFCVEEYVIFVFHSSVRDFYIPLCPFFRLFKKAGLDLSIWELCPKLFQAIPYTRMQYLLHECNTFYTNTIPSTPMQYLIQAVFPTSQLARQYGSRPVHYGP